MKANKDWEDQYIKEGQGWTPKQGQRRPDSSRSQAGNKLEKDPSLVSEAVEGFATEYIQVNKPQKSCVWLTESHQSSHIKQKKPPVKVHEMLLRRMKEMNMTSLSPEMDICLRGKGHRQEKTWLFLLQEDRGDDQGQSTTQRKLTGLRSRGTWVPWPPMTPLSLCLQSHSVPIKTHLGIDTTEVVSLSQNAKISKCAFLSCGLIRALLETLTVLSLFWLTYHLLPDSYTSPHKTVYILFLPFYFPCGMLYNRDKYFPFFLFLLFFFITCIVDWLLMKITELNEILQLYKQEYSAFCYGYLSLPH